MKQSIQTEAPRVFVKVGDMWVKSSWSNVGTVMLTEKQSEVTETIAPDEVKWLKKHFDNVKVFKVTLTEVE